MGDDLTDLPTASSVRVERLGSVAELADRLDAEPALVVTEYELSERETGLDVLSRIREARADLPVVLCTERPDGEVASAATRLGVTEYVPRVSDAAESLSERVAAILDRRARTDGGTSVAGTEFRAVRDGITDAVLTIDGDSEVVYANEAAAELTGYDREELVGDAFTRIMPPRFRERHQAAVETYLRSGERALDWEYLELPIRHRDGHEIPVSASFSETTRGGETYFTGIVRDVTERKERQSQLEESRRRFEAVFDQPTALISILDADCRVEQANDAALSVIDADRDAIEGTQFLETEWLRDADEEALAELRRALDAATAGEPTTFAVDDIYDLPDGRSLCVEGSLQPITDDGAVTSVFAVGRDVTDRRHRERELERANTRLDLALGAIDGGVFSWDVETNEVHLDGTAAAQLGYDAEPATTTPDAFLERVHPDDRPRIEGTVERVLEGADDYSVEYRVERTDGEQRWLATDAVRADGDGPARMVGITRDVTERRETADELRESQDALQRLYEITADKDRAFADQLDALLELGCDRLDLPIGFMTDIDDGDLEIVASHGEDIAGHTAPLADEYCARTVETGLASTTDAATTGWAAGPFERYGLACYIGGEVVVDDETYGTLCFASETPRTRDFTAAEETFVELVTSWLSYELERRERETELRETRDRMERVLERVDAGFFAVDEDWEFTYFNGEAEALLGLSAGDLGANVWDEFPEAIEQAFYDEYHEAMTSQTATTFEEYFPPLESWFGVSAYPAEDGLSVYFEDITERKERETMLTDLLETTRALMAAPTPQDVADVVVRAARETLGFELNLVRLYDAERDALDPVSLTDETAALLGERPVYDADEGVPGRAFTTGEPVLYSDHPEEHAGIGPVQEAICLPLGEHGTLTLSSRSLDGLDATDRQVAEILATNARAALDRAHREQELVQYETVMETVQQMVFVLDEDARFVQVTTPLADRLGHDREDLIGTDAAEYLVDGDLSPFVDDVESLLADEATESLERETVLETAGGETFPAAVDLSLLPSDTFGGTVGVVRDQTELERTREQLADERDRFTYLFDNLPDAVVETELVDGDPVVQSTNDAFEDVFGYDAGRVVGESLDDYVVPVDHEAGGEHLDAAALGTPVQTEVRRRTAEGERYFLYRGIPYDVRGERTHAFGIYTDITEQRDRERQLQVLNRVLRHNIRNDLTVVLGQADQLRRELDDERHLGMVDSILRKADQIAGLGEKSRRIEQCIGHSVTDCSVDVAALARDVAAAFRSTHPGADVVVDAPRSLSVRGDGQLESALSNLVENAIEHNPADEPRVRIDVRAVADSEGVELVVADDGPGIPENEQTVVGGRDDITQLNHASGLGLWLVRWIVEACGGDISFDEERSEGAAVTLRLERADADPSS